ncbi:MAG TPA: alcohol dehydrogenase catalytic domain-containing protein [Dehalococcoidia bacterium]|nr:alcohol dehydrogenase catalytic domain-containing protein [Dehalococcoidia bacterium]
MRSAVLVGPRQIEIEEIDRPEVDDDTVIVMAEGLGVCGSNLHWWYGGGSATGAMFFPMKGAGGHEFSGTIEEVGKNISKVKVGDRVAIDQFHSTSCGACKHCGAGWFNQCLNRNFFGQVGFVEYMKFTEKGLHVLPDHIETHAGAIAEPAAAPISAMRRLGITGGERVVVLGAGVLGLAAAGAAREMGAEQVVITAKYDHQIEFARKFEADAVIPSNDEKVVERILSELGGYGADIVIETVGGHAPTLSQAADVVRQRGTVLVLGLWDELVPMDSWKSVLKDITYKFCLTYGQNAGIKTDYEYTIDLMSSRKVPMQDLITHVIPLEKTAEAFELAADKSQGVMKVIVKP